MIFQYIGQDNLGLVNVNTFDVQQIEINRYSAQGVLIEEPTGYMTLAGAPLGDSRAHTMTDVDRGYSHVDIQLSGNGVDAEAIGVFLCQECLDTFAKLYFEDDNPPEISVINFATRELRPLVETCPGLFLIVTASTAALKMMVGFT